MRTLDEHKINPGNDTLTITVLDEPGHGGLVAGGSLSMTNLQNDKPLAGARQRKAMACRSVVMHNEKLSGRSDRDGRA